MLVKIATIWSLTDGFLEVNNSVHIAQNPKTKPTTSCFIWSGGTLNDRRNIRLQKTLIHDCLITCVNDYFNNNMQLNHLIDGSSLASILT
jgi:hypothetical protein